MSGAAGRRRALGLYRGILRAHRSHLPDNMRHLGDAYVREEFRKHKAAKDKFLGPFFREWDKYLVSLTSQSALLGPAGADLPADALSALTDEQREQLARLRREVEASGNKGALA